MALPDWRTASAGARIRVALWLATEVGVGNSFTKADLRNAFPGIEQIDRRMRDLRADGWDIRTYREDRSLAPDELRLVQLGGAVWEPGFRSKMSSPGVSDRERRKILASDGFACIFCGIGAGESYADDPVRRARLTIARTQYDADTERFRTVCDRCHVAMDHEIPADDVLRAITELDVESRQRIVRWMRRGSRSREVLDEVWGEYRRLASSDRDLIREHMSQIDDAARD